MPDKMVNRYGLAKNLEIFFLVKDYIEFLSNIILTSYTYRGHNNTNNLIFTSWKYFAGNMGDTHFSECPKSHYSVIIPYSYEKILLNKEIS